MTRALPIDPSQWQHNLNEWGKQGWDVTAIQQSTMGGLSLYLVTFLRPAIAVSMQYAVLIAEFPANADSSTLMSVRTQLELQTNENTQAGWQFLQSVTGQRSPDSLFLSLLFKKPAP
jgi:hypothetical protein